MISIVRIRLKKAAGSEPASFKQRLTNVAVAGLVCLVVAPSLALARDAKVDPDARRLLDEVVTAYKGLKAYQDHGVAKIAMSIDGKLVKREVPVDLAFRRPDRIALNAGDARLQSDGEKLTIAVRPTGKYLTVPAPKEIRLESITEGPMGALLLGDPIARPVKMILDLLLSEDPVAILLEGGSGLRPGPDDTRDGVTYKTLLLDPDQGPDYRLWVDPKTRLIAAIEQAIDPGVIEALAPAGTRISDARIGWNGGSISTEPPPDDVFTFHPPVGFTRVTGPEPRKDAAQAAERPGDALVGKPAPEFTLTVLAPDGKSKRVSKADLAGKVVVLDFWATWCPPCLAELPEIQKLVDAYNKAGKDVLIFAVSQDQPPDDKGDIRELIEQTLAEKKVSLKGPVGNVALDPNQALGEAFQVEAIPAVVILDGKGTVQSVHVGFSEDARQVLTADIDALLAGRSLIETKPNDAKQPADKPAKP